jgi:hypothetical protein
MAENAPQVPKDEQEHPVYRAEDVRQGEVILKTPLRRWIFLAGLIAIVILVIIGRFAAG